MGQTHSFDDAEYGTIIPSVGVPTLDWPSDLFSDNVCPTDVAMVDFLLQCDPDFVADSYQNEQLHIQLAA